MDEEIQWRQVQAEVNRESGYQSDYEKIERELRGKSWEEIQEAKEAADRANEEQRQRDERFLEWKDTYDHLLQIAYGLGRKGIFPVDMPEAADSRTRRAYQEGLKEYNRTLAEEQGGSETTRGCST